MAKDLNTGATTTRDLIRYDLGMYPYNLKMQQHLSKRISKPLDFQLLDGKESRQYASPWSKCIRKNMLVDKEVVHRVNIYETLPDCHEHCYNDNNCNHFDYGFYSKRCRIFNEKRDELTFIENLDHVTGPKTCSDTVHTNIHSKGKEILISENYYRKDLTITKCRYKCLNDISCKAWTHFDDQCYLYSYPLYIYDLWEQGPNTPIFYGVNTKCKSK
nr:uncharacterized protein LOC121124394 [Lepeophtheirus salmonis]